ncbi:MAG: ribonuclease III [Gammaproteobacteria bacterium]|nr:ribonuclease III [Gammaproteobacteria bacterium]
MKKTVNKLMSTLGYSFQSTALLETALRHRSMKTNNNERLEFLGDSILNVVITAALYRLYPHSSEGKLSQLRASLVRKETLAELAKELSLGEFLSLGPGELKSGGSRRSSILADAMEAVMGAVYLDAGFDACQALILKWYDARLTQPELINEGKDAKTALQEYLQAKKRDLPVYEVMHVKGELHDQVFCVSCEIPSLRLKTEGKGMSRRQAEQKAAKLMLDKLILR